MSVPFEATYTLTLSDFHHLQRMYGQLTAWRRARPYVSYGLFLILAVGVAVGVLMGDEGLATVFGIYVVLYGLFLIVNRYWLRPRYIRRNFEDQRLGRGPIRFTARDDGFQLSASDSESQHHWQIIRRVDRLGEHCILWPNKAVGIIIPYRGFQDRATAEAFVAFAEEKTRGQTL
ncbi:MAG: YcxB family protein [Pseudomonadota bacterium]